MNYSHHFIILWEKIQKISSYWWYFEWMSLWFVVWYIFSTRMTKLNYCLSFPWRWVTLGNAANRTDAMSRESTFSCLSSRLSGEIPYTRYSHWNWIRRDFSILWDDQETIQRYKFHYFPIFTSNINMLCWFS